MRIVRTATLTLLLASGMVFAADAPTGPGALLAQRLAVREKIRQIGLERQAATADQNTAMQAAGDSISLLGGPAVTDERIAQMQNELSFARSRVASLQMQLEIAKITDPAARAAKKKELEASRDKLQKEVQKLSEPFQARTEEARKPLQQTDKEWAAALGAYFKSGTGKFADAIKGSATWFSQGETGQMQWNDAKSQQVAWAGLFMMDKPPTPYPGQKLLDGKYPISSSTTNIWVEAGYVKIALNVTRKEWQGDEKALSELVKDLIDLDALAALKPVK